jgi:hypothetical protein
MSSPGLLEVKPALFAPVDQTLPHATVHPVDKIQGVGPELRDLDNFRDTGGV